MADDKLITSMEMESLFCPEKLADFTQKHLKEVLHGPRSMLTSSKLHLLQSGPARGNMCPNMHKETVYSY